MNDLYARLRAFAVTAAFLATLFATPGHAALIEGADVWFEYDDASRFGVASVSGNTISFAPTDFGIQTSDGVPVHDSDFADLMIRVWAKAGSGFAVNGGRLVESGSYFLQGADSEVTARGSIWVSQGTPDSFVPLGMDSLALDGPIDTVGVESAWRGDASVNFASAPEWGAGTVFNFAIDSYVSAYTVEPGSVARATTDSISLEVVSAVPLPGAVWLFGSALLGVVGMRRCRSN